MIRLVLVALVLAAAGCDGSDAKTYALYRNSPGDVPGSASYDPSQSPMRIHVATFDAIAGEDYNRQNCEIARSLFQAQPGVIVRYWCEKGRFRK